MIVSAQAPAPAGMDMMNFPAIEVGDHFTPLPGAEMSMSGRGRIYAWPAHGVVTEYSREPGHRAMAFEEWTTPGGPDQISYRGSARFEQTGPSTARMTLNVREMLVPNQFGGPPVDLASWGWGGSHHMDTEVVEARENFYRVREPQPGYHHESTVRFRPLTGPVPKDWDLAALGIGPKDTIKGVMELDLNYWGGGFVHKRGVIYTPAPRT